MACSLSPFVFNHLLQDCNRLKVIRFQLCHTLYILFFSVGNGKDDGTGSSADYHLPGSVSHGHPKHQRRGGGRRPCKFHTPTPFICFIWHLYVNIYELFGNIVFFVIKQKPEKAVKWFWRIVGLTSHNSLR